MATKTFTVYRRNATQVVGNNIIPMATGKQTPISTGESILLKDQVGIINNDKGGAVFSGMYIADTFVDTPIMLGDILMDENETNVQGEHIKYEVQGKTINIFNTKLHLRRTDIGV
jgi:hypothetical protein